MCGCPSPQGPAPYISGNFTHFQSRFKDQVHTARFPCLPEHNLQSSANSRHPQEPTIQKRVPRGAHKGSAPKGKLIFWQDGGPGILPSRDRGTALPALGGASSNDKRALSLGKSPRCVASVCSPCRVSEWPSTALPGIMQTV